MFELEKAIKGWIKSLHKYEVFEDGLIADLELHFRDVVEDRYLLFCVARASPHLARNHCAYSRKNDIPDLGSMSRTRKLSRDGPAGTIIVPDGR